MDGTGDENSDDTATPGNDSGTGRGVGTARGAINSSVWHEKIQPLLDRLSPIFQIAYTPGQHLAIDESIIAFKGKISCL